MPKKFFSEQSQMRKGNKAPASNQATTFNLRSVVVSFLLVALLVQSFGLAALPTAQAASLSTTKVRPHVQFAQTYFANKITDDLGTTNNGVCSDSNNSGASGCSLRSAITNATLDAHSGPDLIVLEAGATYVLSSTIAAIPGNVYVSSDPSIANDGILKCPSQADGATISGNNTVGGALILTSNDVLNGVTVSNFTSDGIEITGSNNWVTCSSSTSNSGRGISLITGAQNNQIGGYFGNSAATYFGNNGPEVYVGNNGGDGIIITGTGTTGNTVRNVIVGATPTSTTNTANTAAGIEIGGGASGNTIGSTLITETNIIAHNTQAGILLTDANTSSNSIEGNYIGTVDGSTAVGNGASGAGIIVQNSASQNTIGGDRNKGFTNVIGGNNTGILLDDASNNTIEGNLVGLNANGSAALGNVSYGISLTNSSQSNIIGGEEDASSHLGNIVSGNGIAGIALSGSANNKFYGNRIGTDSTGKNAIANGNGLVIITGSDNTIVGGTGAGQPNIISGNTGDGISISGIVSGTLIVHNEIGTDISGDFTGVNPTTTSIPNSTGIALSNGATNTIISQTVVAFNTTEGILVGSNSSDTATTQNTITQNSIYGNGGKGININLSGPNGGVASPVITSANINTVNNTNTYEVMGTAPANSTVEIFLSDSRSGSNQGVTYFGTTTADGTGAFDLSGNLPTGFTLQFNPQLVGTATLNNSTSQFSQASSVFVKSLLSIDNTTLSFSATQGANQTFTKTLNLSASNASVNFHSVITPTVTWLTAAPSVGRVNVNSTVPVTITVDSTGLTAGTYSTVVGYVDNNNPNDSALVSVTLTVNPVAKSNSTTTLTASATTVTQGQSVTFTATVAGGNGTPSGTVTFFDGTTQLGNAVTLANGVATFTTSSLSAGTHGITAVYSGDSTYNGSTSNAVNVTVNTTSGGGGGGGNSYIYYLPFVANNANNFTTFLAFQNIGSATANVNITYYDSNGNVISAASVVTQVVQYGEAIPTNPLASGATGAGVITSTQPLNVIVPEATPYGGSAYAVSSGSSNSLIAPFALNNAFGDFTTQLNIFNGGDSSATANVNFYGTVGQSTTIVTSTTSVTIGAHKTANLNQNTLPSGFSGWAQISGSASTLVAQILEQSPNTKFVAIANAVSNPSATEYAPAIFNSGYGSFYTGANIVNPNANPVTVTVTYYDLSATMTATTPFAIPAYGVASIFNGSTSGNGLPSGGLPKGFIGSMSVSAVGGNIAMSVNENGGITSAGNSRSGTYAAIANGASTVGLPVVSNGGFTYVTGDTILNTSSQPVTATITYYNTNGTAISSASKTFTIAGHGSQAYYQGDGSLPSNFYGTAVITETGGPANSLIATTNAQNIALFYTYSEPNS